MFGKELFIRFTVHVFRERLSICVCVFFLFGFEGGLWDLIVYVSDHCLLCETGVISQERHLLYHKIKVK